MRPPPCAPRRQHARARAHTHTHTHTHDTRHADAHVYVHAGAPFHAHPDVSLAYLVVEATGPLKAEGGHTGLPGDPARAAPSRDEEPPPVLPSDVARETEGGGEGGQGGDSLGGGGQGGGGERAGVYSGQQVRLSEVGRARGAAKQLLARQRENLVLWGALAELEALAGNMKVGGAKAGRAFGGREEVVGVRCMCAYVILCTHVRVCVCACA